MSSSLTRPRVAFQGEPGAFSEDAALKLLGREIQLVPRPTFAALFRSLDEGLADYALAPVENSFAGVIKPVAELLAASSLQVSGEVVIAVHQQLIACPGVVFSNIEAVESHPAALAQCQGFFAAHPRLQRIETDDTAGSVAGLVNRGDKTRAAIASRRAAEIYGGVIIRENLQDDPDNHTRFLLLKLGRGTVVAESTASTTHTINY